MRIYNFTGEALEEDKLKIDSVEKFLDDAYNRWTTNDMFYKGTYKCMGWLYDFRPHLKRYVVKQNGMWHECYCINKKLVRKNFYTTIDEIVEIKNKHKLKKTQPCQQQHTTTK
jgi:hypothetical protein